MPSLRELEAAAQQVRETLPRRKERHPLHELVQQLESAVPTRTIADQLRARDSEEIIPIVLMGRVASGKRKTEKHQSVPSRCRTWIGLGARAFVLDETVLQADGLPAGISTMHEHVSAPFLDSRIIVDEYQLYDARVSGFDAVILHASLLPSGGIKRFLGVARDMDMECIVACATKKDVDAALRADARVFGMYNSEAGVHEQNITPTIMLKRFVPNNVVTLGMDDNRTLYHIRQLREAGFDGVFLNEQVLESGDVREFFSRFSKHTQ